MTEEQLVELITAKILRVLAEEKERSEPLASCLPDLTSAENKSKITLTHARDMELIQRMREKTPARIALGSAGPRLRTNTYLTLRADHAGARDAVQHDVDDTILRQMGLFTIQTQCTCRDEFLTRPDLGRQLSEETASNLRRRCQERPQVQIYVADGLSGQAVEANIEDILPALEDGLQQRGIRTGTPFFMRFGRVPAMDRVSEILQPEVICVLLGERPGLATANSMSAYIAYRATVGMPEARRTVVSNIHAGGTPPAEAGAYIAELIETILKEKKSGVELTKRGTE